MLQWFYMQVCRNCDNQLDTLVSTGLFSPDDLIPLRSPRRIHATVFSLRMDDGTCRFVEGYRVQYNDALGPTKGGIRIHASADLEDVTELAFLMSLKTSLLGLPYGGAKGAIRIDPKTLSEGEFNRLIRAYMEQITPVIGASYDIPAPDVNVSSDTIARMLDAYETVSGISDPATFTGKPFARGGSLGRETATARGGFYILQAHYTRDDRAHTTVAIQGFGNVGSHLAAMMHDEGYKVVAISDSKTALYNKNGLPIPDILRAYHNNTPLSKQDEKQISNGDLLELEVDLLIPAALGGVITKNNAARINARTILEMANAPVTPEADPMLAEKNVVVIPDILANAGGVVVSYFEWLQNKQGESWTNQKVHERLKEIMHTAYTRVDKECSRRPNHSLRTVCYLVAIKRILEAEREHLKQQ